VERNGQPPPVAKQTENLERLERETPAQRAERLRKEEEELRHSSGEILKAFDFELIGEEIVNGRPAYVLQATPHPGYQAQGKYGKMFSKLGQAMGRQAKTLDGSRRRAGDPNPSRSDYSWRACCAVRTLRWEQTRVDGGIWMPEHVEIRSAAKIFFIKSLVIDRS